MPQFKMNVSAVFSAFVKLQIWWDEADEGLKRNEENWIQNDNAVDENVITLLLLAHKLSSKKQSSSLTSSIKLEVCYSERYRFILHNAKKTSVMILEKQPFLPINLKVVEKSFPNYLKFIVLLIDHRHKRVWNYEGMITLGKNINTFYNATVLWLQF